MEKLSANDPRVVSFFSQYHEKIKTRPSLYRSGSNVVTITLPADLLDYANAAAGHSGFGAGARPVGIRKTVDNVDIFVTKTFSSLENVAEFLNSSECDGLAYVEHIKTRGLDAVKEFKKLSTSLIDTRPAKDALYAEGYDYAFVKSLCDKYGRDTVQRDLTHLQWTEFQLRYGLI